MIHELLLRDFKNQNKVRVEVEVCVLPHELKFDFRLNGPEISEIQMESLKAPERRGRKDELWKATCFELFWGGAEDEYYEMNLSPSGDWQFYRFSAYRSGQEEAKCTLKDVKVHVEPRQIKISGTIVLSNQSPAPTRIHPTVILKVGAEFHYFAPKHPPDKPDFHDQKYWTPID